jgi:hypothetical protein
LKTNDINTTPQSNKMTTTTSLFIPNVFATADEIATVFAYYGVVKRVDRVKQTAFVHFVEWHNTSEATDMQRRIQAGGCVKVFYDGSLFWRTFAAKNSHSSDKKPIKHVVLEELPPWEDPTPDAPIPERFVRPHLVRQDSKPLWNSCDELNAVLNKPALFRHTNTLTPPIDFDALVTNPAYGVNVNTPKTELRSLSQG